MGPWLPRVPVATMGQGVRSPSQKEPLGYDMTLGPEGSVMTDLSCVFYIGGLLYPRLQLCGLKVMSYGISGKPWRMVTKLGRVAGHG